MILMDVSSLLSSLSSSLSPCRKLCCFHPSAQLESWGSASSTCPVCPSYVLVGHHDCSASLSLWEVSQPQGESYTVLGLSVAYLSHAHSCLPSHYPPKAVRCDSFLQLCCALCLFAERHFFFCKRLLSLLHGFLQVNSVIVSCGNVIPADYSCM